MGEGVYSASIRAMLNGKPIYIPFALVEGTALEPDPPEPVQDEREDEALVAAPRPSRLLRLRD